MGPGRGTVQCWFSEKYMHVREGVNFSGSNSSRMVQSSYNLELCTKALTVQEKAYNMVSAIMTINGLNSWKWSERGHYEPATNGGSCALVGTHTELEGRQRDVDRWRGRRREGEGQPHPIHP